MKTTILSIAAAAAITLGAAGAATAGTTTSTAGLFEGGETAKTQTVRVTRRNKLTIVQMNGKVQGLRRSRARRHTRFAISRCFIHRHREQLPNGRWVIVNHKHCPTTGTLAR